MKLAVDFDGTLVSENWPDIVDFDMDLIEAFIHAKEKGHQIILHTCREGEHLDEALESMALLGLEFDAVNENVEKEFHGLILSRKPSADVYFDNKSFNWDRDQALMYLHNLVGRPRIDIFERLRRSIIKLTYRLEREQT